MIKMKRTGKLLVLLSSIICLAAILFTVCIYSSAATSISGATVSSISAQTYTGRAVTPAVTVKYGSRTLTKGTHYTVAYKNNTNVGIATVTITGRGSYSGTKAVNYYIVSPAVKGLAYKNIQQTSVYLYWTASAKATGYQVWRYDFTARAYKLVRTVTANAVTLTGFDAGSTTNVRVRPYTRLSTGKLVYGPFCNPVKVLTRAANVTGVAQSAAKPTAATVSWKAAAGATGYQVYFYNADTNTHTYKGIVKTTSVTLTGLEPSLSTYVRVRPYRTINGANYVSTLCAPVQLKTLPAGNATGLKAAKIADSYVTLSWDAVEGAELYRIYQLKSGKWTAVALATANTRVMTSLTPCTDYSFRVVTCVKSGSKYFNGATTTTLNLTTVPQRVTGLKAAVTNKSVALTWTAVNLRTGYEVYKLDTAAGEYVLVDTCSAAIYVISGLPELTSYSYKVRAYYKTSGGDVLYGDFSDVCAAKTDDSEVDSIKVTCTASSIGTGSSVQCTATVVPSYADATAITWSSSDISCATVSQTGLVTGKSIGSVTIYATDENGNRGYCTIKVEDKVSSVKLTKNTLSLAINEKAALAYEVIPASAANTNVSFTSSRTSVATVNAYGLITAVGAGTTTITVTSRENSAIKATCTVTVASASVSSISIPSELTIYVGQTYRVNPAFSPANATNKTFSISIKNVSVLFTTYQASSYITVSGSTIKGIKATGTSRPGPFTMTVTTANGKTATCKVTVISGRTAVTGVAVGSDTDNWYPGQTGSLTATVSPATATDQTVTWASSNSNIATVDANGKVLAVYPGTATITATTTDGKFKAEYTVRVQKRISPTSIILSASSVELVSGANTQLKATVLPANATSAVVRWSTSNRAVALVSTNGLVTALSAGTTVITATVDGTLSATCTVKVGVRSVSVSPNTYYENLSVGREIQLTASVFPKTLDQSVTWISSNPSVATVTANGLVTMIAPGSAAIYVTSVADSTLKAVVSVNTGKYVMPDASSASALISSFSEKLNKIKMYDLPAFTSVNTVNFKDVKLAKPSALVGEDDFISMFSDFAEDETKSMAAVADLPEYSTARADYWNTIPVKGYSNNIIAGLDPNCVNMSKSGLKDNGSTYTMTITLNAENFNTLPQRSDNPNHGKIFDVLYKSYIDECMKELNSIKVADGVDISMSFTGFKTKYHDSSVTITVDKATNKVIRAEYDMNVLVNIDNLVMKATIALIPLDFINSNVSFDVNSHTDIVFTY